MKIVHVVGARPNLMKVAPVMRAIAAKEEQLGQSVAENATEAWADAKEHSPFRDVVARGAVVLTANPGQPIEYLGLLTHGLLPDQPRVTLDAIKQFSDEVVQLATRLDRLLQEVKGTLAGTGDDQREAQST